MKMISAVVATMAIVFMFSTSTIKADVEQSFLEKHLAEYRTEQYKIQQGIVALKLIYYFAVIATLKK